MICVKNEGVCTESQESRRVLPFYGRDAPVLMKRQGIDIETIIVNIPAMLFLKLYWSATL